MSIRGKMGQAPGIKIKIMLFILGFSLLAVGAVQADTTNLFLKIAGITGGSTQRDHLGWSDILTVNWGVSVPRRPPGAAGPLLPPRSSII